jgi:hypothetical protein
VGGSIDSLKYNKTILKTAVHVNKHVHHLLNILVVMQVHVQMNNTLLKRGNICCNNWDLGCRTEMGQLLP